MKTTNSIYHILTKRRQGVKLAEVVLGLLDSVHARIDGPHEGLLGRSLQRQMDTWWSYMPRALTVLYTK